MARDIHGVAIILNNDEFQCLLEMLLSKALTIMKQQTSGLDSEHVNTTIFKEDCMKAVLKLEAELHKWQDVKKTTQAMAKLYEFPKSAQNIEALVSELLLEVTKRKTTMLHCDCDELHAVIPDICNELVRWANDMDYSKGFIDKREGSLMDVRQMEKLFRQLNFQVEIWNNCTKEVGWSSISTSYFTSIIISELMVISNHILMQTNSHLICHEKVCQSVRIILMVK